MDKCKMEGQFRVVEMGIVNHRVAKKMVSSHRRVRRWMMDHRQCASPVSISLLP